MVMMCAVFISFAVAFILLVLHDNNVRMALRIGVVAGGAAAGLLWGTWVVRRRAAQKNTGTHASNEASIPWIDVGFIGFAAPLVSLLLPDGAIVAFLVATEGLFVAALVVTLSEGIGVRRQGHRPRNRPFGGTT